MSLRHARGCILVLALLLPVLCLAQGSDEVRIIQVDPEAFSAYGHWISEDGEIELRYSDGMTYADGWRISPILQSEDPETMDLKVIPETGLSPKRKLVLEVCTTRDSMYAAGDSPEKVIAACKDLLQRSGLVDTQAAGKEGEKVEDGIAHVGGPLYRIHWLNKPPSQMKLGGPEVAPSEENMKAIRENQAYIMFQVLARHLSEGHGFLLSAHPVPRGMFVPRERMGETAAILREAQESFSPITVNSWEKRGLIDYSFAEQARQPLPVTRKEGS